MPGRKPQPAIPPPTIKLVQLDRQLLPRRPSGSPLTAGTGSTSGPAGRSRAEAPRDARWSASASHAA